MAGFRGKIDFRVVTMIVLVLAVGGFALSRVGALRNPVLRTAGAAELRSNEDYVAPDFLGIAAWINSAPLTVAALRGQVVLVDFWTYSCVNCIRTLPFLKAFYSTYKQSGLQIVGVHSPEFSFEKDQANVQTAVQDHEVTWPVAMDNDLRTWGAYKNQYWPHVYVLDRAGHVRYDFVGEGKDKAIETAIRTLLARPGQVLPPPVTLPQSELSKRLTPEIYLGPQRGIGNHSLANPEGYRQGHPFRYATPTSAQIQEAGPGGQFFLAGTWMESTESIQPAAPGAQVILSFSAKDVYIVGGPQGSTPASLSISMDGQSLTPDVSGDAVRNSVLTMDRRDLFHLIHLPQEGLHVLTLTAPDASALLFTFTFG
jgi:thiol-disulfide isomerase/thioredoxin